MADSENRRGFSQNAYNTNKVFLSTDDDNDKVIKVGFILQEHFSMVAFTAAVDALVTANLVLGRPLFDYRTLGIDSQKVTSDLGIEISTGLLLNTLSYEQYKEFDILIVCGGYRCTLEPNHKLSRYLKIADACHLMLGGLWNGVVPLAHAGLLEQMECAAHPDNHAFIQERFPGITVSANTLCISDTRVSCAGPTSALELMLKLIGRLKGDQIVRAVREILSCDQVAENQDSIPLQLGDDPTLPEHLRDMMTLMRNNIEEPLELDELAAHAGVSRRQMERLFQHHLETSPSRYYLELRITKARRLLLQSNDSISSIALACGFVSNSHFSNCFKDYFGVSPSAARQKQYYPT